jgi:hypothetical protein
VSDIVFVYEFSAVRPSEPTGSERRMLVRSVGCHGLDTYEESPDVAGRPCWHLLHDDHEEAVYMALRAALAERDQERDSARHDEELTKLEVLRRVLTERDALRKALKEVADLLDKCWWDLARERAAEARKLLGGGA